VQQSGVIMLKMCLNWKVLAGLAAAGLGIWAVAPGVVGAALPLLLLAACPLSMLVMVLAMRGAGTHAGDQRPADEPPVRLQAELDAARAREEALVAELARLEGERAPSGAGGARRQ
jgi:hypothetical protein